MKSSPLFFIFLLYAFLVCAKTSNRLNIAVNDLQGKAVEQSAAEIISDRLRSRLISTGVFRVMERNEMHTVLKEQGFQRTGACESSCLVEVGQLLGVERMIAGSIGKLESLYTISLRMIDVATGQILFSVDEDYEGDIKGVLSIMTKSAAEKFADIVENENVAIEDPDHVALHVSSKPKGASVFIDNKQVGKTPYYDSHLEPGNYSLKVLKDTYIPIDETIEISHNTTVSKKFVLKHTKSFIDSMDIKRAAFRSKFQWVRRVAFGTIAAAAMSGGLYYNSKVNDGYDKQKEIQRDYESATRDFDSYEKRSASQKSKNQDNAEKRNALYALAGACLTGFVISIPF